MHLKCPNCGSDKIIPSKGPFIADAVFNSPKYTCKECEYTGSLIMDDSNEEKKSKDLMIHDLEKITREGIKKEIYSGFFPRFMALFADYILIGIIFYPISLPLSLFLSVYEVIEIPALVILFILILYFIYFTGIKGATPGKNIFHLKVVDKNDKNIGIKIAVIRETGKILLLVVLPILFPLITYPASWISSDIRFIAIIFSLGVIASFLIIIFDSKKQSLWDKLAGSYVARNERSSFVGY